MRKPLLFFSEEKRSRTKSLNRSRRKRETRETVLSKEQVTVRFKRSLLVARTHTQTLLRGSGRHAHRRTQCLSFPLKKSTLRDLTATRHSSKLRILTKSAIWTKCLPKQFVANDHRFQNLRSFDEKGCLRGGGRRGVLIPVGFLRAKRVLRSR